jgi:outer membrane protein assembly factor BamB
VAAKSAPVPASLPPFLFVGIKGSVVALRRDTGEIAWTTALPKGSSLVPLVVEGGRVIAISGGEVSCLDPATGKRLWHNKLKGYGTGYAMLAGSQNPSAVAAIAAATVAAAAGASAAVSASAS